MNLHINVSTEGHPEDLLDRIVFILRESGDWVISDEGSLRWTSLRNGLEDVVFDTSVRPQRLVFRPESRELAVQSKILGTVVERLIAEFGEEIRMIRIQRDKEDAASLPMRDAREDTLTILKKILDNGDKSESERVQRALNVINQILVP